MFVHILALVSNLIHCLSHQSSKPVGLEINKKANAKCGNVSKNQQGENFIFDFTQFTCVSIIEHFKQCENLVPVDAIKLNIYLVSLRNMDSLTLPYCLNLLSSEFEG